VAPAGDARPANQLSAPLALAPGRGLWVVPAVTAVDPSHYVGALPPTLAVAHPLHVGMVSPFLPFAPVDARGARCFWAQTATAAAATAAAAAAAAGLPYAAPPPSA